MERADVVVVPPYYKGDKYSPIKLEEVDNSHNTALARHVRRDPAFAFPEVLMMGQRHPVALFVYFRKDRILEPPPASP